MAAVDWSTTVTALDAAIAGAVGVDLELGQDIRAELAALGAVYDGQFTAAADTAKTAWLAAATSAHDEADEAALYALTLLEEPPAPFPSALTFDAYDNAAIVARCRASEKAATGFVLEAIEAHREAVEELFRLPNAATLAAFVPYWGGSTSERVKTYGMDSLGEGSVMVGLRWTVVSTTHPPVRETELAIVALIADATDWLALVAYP